MTFAKGLIKADIDLMGLQRCHLHTIASWESTFTEGDNSPSSEWLEKTKQNIQNAKNCKDLQEIMEPIHTKIRNYYRKRNNLSTLEASPEHEPKNITSPHHTTQKEDDVQQYDHKTPRWSSSSSDHHQTPKKTDAIEIEAARISALQKVETTPKNITSPHHTTREEAKVRQHRHETPRWSNSSSDHHQTPKKTKDTKINNSTNNSTSTILYVLIAVVFLAILFYLWDWKQNNKRKKEKQERKKDQEEKQQP